MKRTIPLIITAVAGFIMIVSFFVPLLQWMGETAAVWFDVLAGIAFILGGGNLLKLHLKKMSDRKPGWGYSAVTIVAFLATLIFGLLKLGSGPTPNVEFYGETFAALPLSEMPEYRVAGNLPRRIDHKRLPPSVLEHLREENGELVFRGWMSSEQFEDLLNYYEPLWWKALVEELQEKTEPKELLGIVDYQPNKRVMDYHPTQRVLVVRGVLTEALAAQLTELLPATPRVQRAIRTLAEQSRRETVFPQLLHRPASLSVPADLSNRIRLEENRLQVTGPLSRADRDRLTGSWCNFPHAHPLSVEQQQALLQRLNAAGGELNETQQKSFSQFFAAQWGAEAFIAAVNTAGVRAAPRKSYRELYAEQQAGVEELVPVGETPPPVLLNADQQAAVRRFMVDPDFSVDDLKAALSAGGEILPAQLVAVDRFLASLPREAEKLKDLGLELLREGSLTSEQQAILFAPFAEQHRWRVEVARMFLQTHQVKYPWSGDFSYEGNPFWWTYEFVLQPLMTTTFAMLAFYVASAAFRAFRAKNLEAVLLLGTAFIVLLGRTFLGVALTSWMPDALDALKIDQMTVYIMKIFNTAGNRAIMIGIALGIASTSLKVLLGIDRSYLGSGDD